MALQADGKIIIVGGTFTDFVPARFNANGTLDASFDGDGKVTIDVAANKQERGTQRRDPSRWGRLSSPDIRVRPVRLKQGVCREADSIYPLAGSCAFWHLCISCMMRWW